MFTELTPVFLPLVLLLASVLGWMIQRALPDRHRTRETTEAMRLLLGMLVTFAALVLGLLTTSAKTHFDDISDRFQTFGIDLVTLDQGLQQYGNGTAPARALLRAYTAAAIASTWPAEPPPAGIYPAHPGRVTPGSSESLELGAMLLELNRQIVSLTPDTPVQDALAPMLAARMATTLQDRWVLVGAARATLAWPFLSVMAGWLILVFAMFGLSEPSNGVIHVMVALAALSLSAAVWLIVELDNPLSGLIGISSVTLRDALFHMDMAG